MPLRGDRRHADRQAARQHAARDAEQLRGVPHRPEILQEGQNLIHKVHGGIGDIATSDPLAGLEFGPDRDARNSTISTAIRNASCPAEADADHVNSRPRCLQLRLMEKKREFLPPIKRD